MSRILIIGIDGASPHLVRRWRNALPNLRRLMEEGASGILQSVIPPRSVPAWYSFATGMNPGKIGIFGFSQRIPGTYDYTFANLSYCRAPTFWQRLNEHLVKTALVHIPGTFPPHPVDGVLVSGWPAPINRGNLVYSHPAELSPQIDELLGDPFEFLSDKPMRVDNDEEMLSERLRILKMHGSVAHWVLSRYDWQVAVAVLSPLDRASHQFWRHLDPSHPAHDPALAPTLGDALRRVYVASDEEVGRLLSLLGDGDTVFVVSDHGFGPALRTFYLNEWLLQNRYLVLKERESVGHVSKRTKTLGKLATPLFWLNRVSPTFRRLADPLKKRTLSNLVRDEYVRAKKSGLVRLNHLSVDWERTRAYCPDESSLYLNLRGRDPKGIVEPGYDSEMLIEEIVKGLRSIPDPETGRPVSVTVHRKEQIYSGDFLAEAPELVIAMDDHRTEVMAELGSEGLFVSSDARNGTHTPDGFLIAKGPGIPAGQRTEASLLDIAPTALHLMGIPIPEESDGEVLLRIYAENAEPRRRPVERDQVGPYGPTGDPGTVYTEEELRQVEKQLRDLGYLG